MTRIPPKKEDAPLPSTLILIWNPVSLPFTIKLPTVLPNGGHSLKGISLLWPPLPGKAIKAIFFSFTQNSLHFDSAPVHRSQVSETLRTKTEAWTFTKV